MQSLINQTEYNKIKLDLNSSMHIQLLVETPEGTSSEATGTIQYNNKPYWVLTKDNIVSVSTTQQLFSDPSIGNCVAGELTAKITGLSPTSFPKMAEIVVRVYLSGTYTETVSGEVVEKKYPATDADIEWIEKGHYFVDTRSVDATSGVINIHAFDAMLKAEQEYTIGAFTTISGALTYICNALNVELDNRTSVNTTDALTLVAGDSIRQLMQDIASANAGNWVITDQNKLRLIPLVPGNSVADYGNRCNKFSDLGVKPAFTGVCLTDASGNNFVAGTEDVLLQAQCSYASLSIATRVFNTIKNFTPHPYKATKMLCDPTLEIGDTYTFTKSTDPVDYTAQEISIKYTNKFLIDVSSPGQEEIDSEYNFKSPIERNIEKNTKEVADLRLKVDSIEVGKIYFNDELFIVDEDQQSGDRTVSILPGGIKAQYIDVDNLSAINVKVGDFELKDVTTTTTESDSFTTVNHTTPQYTTKSPENPFELTMVSTGTTLMGYVNVYVHDETTSQFHLCENFEFTSQTTAGTEVTVNGVFDARNVISEPNSAQISLLAEEAEDAEEAEPVEEDTYTFYAEIRVVTSSNSTIRFVTSNAITHHDSMLGINSNVISTPLDPSKDSAYFGVDGISFTDTDGNSSVVNSSYIHSNDISAHYLSTGGNYESYGIGLELTSDENKPPHIKFIPARGFEEPVDVNAYITVSEHGTGALKYYHFKNLDIGIKNNDNSTESKITLKENGDLEFRGDPYFFNDIKFNGAYGVRFDAPNNSYVVLRRHGGRTSDTVSFLGNNSTSNNLLTFHLSNPATSTFVGKSATAGVADSAGTATSAGTADKLSTPHSIKFGSQSVSFDGSGDVSSTLFALAGTINSSVSRTISLETGYYLLASTHNSNTALNGLWMVSRASAGGGNIFHVSNETTPFSFSLSGTNLNVTSTSSGTAQLWYTRIG